jgi:large subunit ribosomal protein L29
LEAKGRELKRDLFTLRFQLVAGRIENPSKIKATRREIARMKTITREKALGKGVSAT